MPPRNVRPLLSVREASALADKNESWGYRALARGELAGAVQINGRWYVRARVWDAFLRGDDAGDVATEPTSLRRVS